MAKTGTPLKLVDEGDASAEPADVFANLYRDHVERVFRYFYQQAGNAHDAEDLTATTFGKALTSFGQYRSDSATFAAWLLGIARHVLADYWRERRPKVGFQGADDPSASAGSEPEAALLRHERAETLRALIGQLPAEQREALALRFFAELSVQETSRVLGKSEAAIKMLVHRAIVTLRREYQEE